MAATLVNLTGFTFGIASEESGINVESLSFKASSKIIDVLNKDGETRGRVFHDPSEEVTIVGETTEAPSAAIGTSLTVANALNLGGVSAGLWYTETIQCDLAREGLRKLTITAKRYPNITS